MRFPARPFLCGSALLAVALCCPARAEIPPPSPPCQQAPFPAYGPVGSDGSRVVWKQSDLTNWQPAACLGWSGPSHSVVALAAEFRFSGPLEALLARLGALERYPSIKYWSTSRGRWLALVKSAVVVASAGGSAVRASLGANDFAVGRDSFYAETTEESSRTDYRLHVLVRRDDFVAVAFENVTPISALGFTIFGPSALQSVIFLDRRGPDLWGFYSIVRTAAGTSVLARGREASFLNRQAAVFRHLAGIPTDREPPVAR